MNGIGEARVAESTSSGGSFAPVRRMIVVGSLLAALGTSSGAEPLGSEELTPVPAEIQTNSGISSAAPMRPGLAIGKLRRLSGLTWDELARLFGVSRRSLHFWASGRGMSSSNDEHLQRSLGIMLRIDRGTARANRSALMSVQGDGVIPFDVLMRGEYESVVARIGEAANRGRATLSPLSEEEKAARTPRPPADYISDRKDSGYRDAGRSRIAKSVRSQGAP